MKALLAGISIALLAGSTSLHADVQTIGLIVHNETDAPLTIQIYDNVGKTNFVNPGDVNPNAFTIISRAMLDEKGMVNLSITFDDHSQNLPNLHCWNVNTNPNGADPLVLDVTRFVGSFGRC
jgi:hypothetical protein